MTTRDLNKIKGFYRNFGNRTIKALAKNNICCWNDLDEANFLDIPGIGIKSAEEIAQRQAFHLSRVGEGNAIFLPLEYRPRACELEEICRDILAARAGDRWKKRFQYWKENNPRAYFEWRSRNIIRQYKKEKEISNA